jgi:DNA polymerase III alpha subunit
MYLNCHTYYSLRYGTMSVEQLVQKALAAGTDSIVLTDINNSTAIPEFAGECSKNNIRPVAGIEFRNNNERIGIRPTKVNRLLTLSSSINRNYMVILQAVTFADRDDIYIHKSLRAVDNNILLSHLQQWQCAGENELFSLPAICSLTSKV